MQKTNCDRMQLERSSARIELVKLREYAERVASVCNCVFCEDRIDETAGVCRKSCESMQLERSSVRIELVKLREYAGGVASVCNCMFCEDRTDETARVCRKKKDRVASVCNWALTGVGASLNGVASVCNVVCFMSAKSDGRLHE